MLQLGVHTLQLKDVRAERRSKILCAATKTQRNQINIFKEICVAIPLQPQKVIQRIISTVDGYCLVCITEDDRKQEVKMFTDKKQTVDSGAMGRQTTVWTWVWTWRFAACSTSQEMQDDWAQTKCAQGLIYALQEELSGIIEYLQIRSVW